MTTLRFAVLTMALAVPSAAPRLLSAQSTATPPATPAAAPAAAQPARGGGGRGAIRVMTLTSSAFADGAMIPAKHAQMGRDVSPALSWSGVPDSTRSFVLLMHDADQALGNGTDDLLHWMVWGIPGTATSLPEGIPSGGQLASGLRQISASGPYYRGPAAPSTGAAHHYVFELYALDIVPSLVPVGMSPPATRAAMLELLAGHVRGKGVLVGLYRRPAP
ncbi:MAG: YbhB/YbcL family Raf kinase inhibitor-like protein [Gemmatimonadaceae bacterium]